MAKKLTLRMDEDVIERAKEYAAERGISVSKMVEQYFAAVTTESVPDEHSEDDQESLPPFTRRLVNREPSSGDVDEDAYYRHLEEKHR
ncbi:MAG: hypothetical protein BRD55_02640 [Bacteroidetes bacterium SW_9_63_38]|nr:MAG: hypothetical protein BRD55_02640 [Bacteroidetes bacterium SW_9_63_38]